MAGSPYSRNRVQSDRPGLQVGGEREHADTSAPPSSCFRVAPADEMTLPINPLRIGHLIGGNARTDLSGGKLPFAFRGHRREEHATVRQFPGVRRMIRVSRAY